MGRKLLTQIGTQIGNGVLKLLNHATQAAELDACERLTWDAGEAHVPALNQLQLQPKDLGIGMRHLVIAHGEQLIVELPLVA